MTEGHFWPSVPTETSNSPVSRPRSLEPVTVTKNPICGVTLGHGHTPIFVG
jgi:hypothetical protein